MREHYLLPTATGYDLIDKVTKTRAISLEKKAIAQRKRNANRCFGTLSCDCPRCK